MELEVGIFGAYGFFRQRLYVIAIACIVPVVLRLHIVRLQRARVQLLMHPLMLDCNLFRYR